MSSGKHRGLDKADMGAKLAVIVVNYQCAPFTINCIRSVVHELKAISGAHLWVVDNASGDGSIDQISRAIQNESWSEWVTLLPADQNRGFGAGNNGAIKPLLKLNEAPAYYYLLNPDTIVRPDAIKKIIQFMDANTTVGICGTRLEAVDETPQCSAFHFHTIIGEFLLGLNWGWAFRVFPQSALVIPPSDKPHPADWVAGASMMVRREVFENIGLFDEDYFLYFEEVDFCFRAKKKGCLCWYYPESRVVHFVGQSTQFKYGQDKQVRFPKHWFDSRRHFFVKNYGYIYALLADVAWMKGFFLRKIKSLVLSSQSGIEPNFFKDFVKNSVWWKGACCGSK